MPGATTAGHHPGQHTRTLGVEDADANTGVAPPALAPAETPPFFFAFLDDGAAAAEAVDGAAAAGAAGAATGAGGTGVDEPDLALPLPLGAATGAGAATGTGVALGCRRRLGHTDGGAIATAKP